MAKMMILFKLARTREQAYLDNWVDIAGYAACAGEIEDGSYNPEYHEKKVREFRDKLAEKVKAMTPEDWQSVEKIKESDRLYAEAVRSAHNG